MSLLEHIKQVNHKLAIEVEGWWCTLTPHSKLRRATNRFERPDQHNSGIAAVRLLPGRKNGGEEIMVFKPPVLKAEDIWFWDGGGEG